MRRMTTDYLPAGVFLGPMIVSPTRVRAGTSEQQRRSGEQVPANRKVEGLTAYEVAVLLAVAAAILSCL